MSGLALRCLCLLPWAASCAEPAEPLLPAPPPPLRSGLFPFQTAPTDVGPGSRWGYIDRQGQIRIEARYSSAGPFRDGLACVSIGSLFGFIDAQGSVRIPLELRGCRAFSGGLAPAWGASGWGYVDPSGAWVVAPAQPYVTDLSEGLAVASSPRGLMYLNARGRRAFSAEFEVAGPFSGGLAPVVVDRKLGYINRGGQLAIAPTLPFDRVIAITEELLFQDRRAAFSQGCQRRYFDGKTEVDPSDYPMSDPRWSKLSVESSSCAFGYIDDRGAVAIPPLLASAGRFSEGVAAVRRQGARGLELIDVEGRTAVPGRFDLAGPFSEGRATVLVEGQAQLIDRQGQRWPLPEGIRWASPFDDGLARVEGAAGWGYVNAEGHLVWELRSSAPRQRDRPLTARGLLQLRPRRAQGLTAEPRLSAELEAKLPALLPCFERALRVEAVPLWVELEWEISPRGTLGPPRAVGGSARDPQLAGCVIEALRKTSFPPLGAAKARRVGYSLRFVSY